LRRESSLQHESGPVQPDLHRGDADVQNLRGFINAEFFHVAQQNDLPVNLRKRLDGPLQ
jgi:hypothetical protein